MLVANAVANSTNLLEFPIPVIAFLSSGTPTTGRARQLDATAPLSAPPNSLESAIMC